MAPLRLLLHLENAGPRLLDCAPLVQSGLSLGLLDPETFAGVQVNDAGGLEWPNGFKVPADLIAQLLK